MFTSQVAIVYAQSYRWHASLDVFEDESNGGMIVLTVNEVQLPDSPADFHLNLRRPERAADRSKRQAVLDVRTSPRLRRPDVRGGTAVKR